MYKIDNNIILKKQEFYNRKLYHVLYDIIRAGNK